MSGVYFTSDTELGEVGPSECKLKMLPDYILVCSCGQYTFMLRFRCFEVEAIRVTGMGQEVAGDLEQTGRVGRLICGS